MKEILSIIILCAGGTCFAQSAAVAADKMNVLYVGIDNPLTIAAENCPCNSLVVTTDNGKLDADAGCKYHFSAPPELRGQKATITVSQKHGKVLRQVGVTEFRIKGLPLPTAKIAGKNEGSIRLNILKAQLGIIASLDGFDFDFRCVVTDFKLTLIHGNRNCSTLSCQGPRFSEEAKALFTIAQPGDQLLIFQIKANTAAEKGISLLPFELVIE